MYSDDDDIDNRSRRPTSARRNSRYPISDRKRDDSYDSDETPRGQRSNVRLVLISLIFYYDKKKVSFVNHSLL